MSCPEALPRPAGISASLAKPSINGELGTKATVTPVCAIGLERLFSFLARHPVMWSPRSSTCGSEIGANTGMREGELFGLRWRDVDLKGRMISVQRQYTHGEMVEFPKTDAGCRDIGIDAKLATELTAWKLQQKAELRTDDSLVIGTATGEPMSASNFLQRDFYPALERAGLPKVRFHSVRHTAATILASSATPPGAVHRILGHASFATTMKLYGGLTADALESAAGTMGNAFEPKQPEAKRS